MEDPIVKAEVVETQRVEIGAESTEPLKLEPPKSRSSTPIPKRPKIEEKEFESTEPMHETVGGSSIRRYLNENLTSHLLDGLRQISQSKPENPLRWLGEFLIERANQLDKKD